MNRQGSGPGRSTRGRASEAAYPDRDAYQRDSYLEADAYPVDPGYQGYGGGRDRERPRPADMPAGPWRTRPERGLPLRPGYPPRAGKQPAYESEAADRPWQRPEDAMPGVGRPRPRPTGPRPRQAPPGQPRPGQQRQAPPRGPRPAGFYEPQRPGPRAYASESEPGSASYAAGPQASEYQAQAGYQGQGQGQGWPPGPQTSGYPGQNFAGPAQGWAEQPYEGPEADWQPGPGANRQPPGYQPGQEWAATEVPRQPASPPGPGQGQGGGPGQYPEHLWSGQQEPGWQGSDRQSPDWRDSVWQGAGQAPRPGQGAYGPPGQAWPPGPPGYGQEESGQGPAGFGPGQFASGQPGSGRFGAEQGPRPPTEVRSVKASPVRISSVRAKPP